MDMLNALLSRDHQHYAYAYAGFINRASGASAGSEVGTNSYLNPIWVNWVDRDAKLSMYVHKGTGDVNVDSCPLSNFDLHRFITYHFLAFNSTVPVMIDLLNRV